MELKLYEVTDIYLRALKGLEDSDLPENVVLNTLDALEGALEVKATNVAAYFQNLEAEANAIKNAETRMAKRRKAIESRVEWLRHYLKTNMDRCGITEIKSPEFVLKIVKNPPMMVIDHQDAIPEQFMRIIPETREPDKNALKEALKTGEVIPGAHLETQTRLSIK